MNSDRLTVVQLLPELAVGGVERGTVEIAGALCAAGHRAVVISAGGRLVSELEAVGGEHIELAIGKKSLSSLRLVKPLAATLEAVKADVVHARSRLPAWLGFYALKRLSAATRPRWVTTVHGPYSVNRYSAIMVSGEQVIAISEFIRNYIRQNYPQVSASAINVIPRGVDPSVYCCGYKPDASWLKQFTDDFPMLINQTVLAMPGRLTRWKGQLDFIQMLHRLHTLGHPFHGLLIGAAHAHKPAYTEELKRRCEDLGLQSFVHFLGNRHDMREILSYCDCAYSLTREPEAFGRTTIEALSLGTPVIGYEHGGTGEILREVFNQGLVKTGDTDAAAEATLNVLKNNPPVNHAHRFTVDAMCASTLEIYQQLVAP